MRILLLIPLAVLAIAGAVLITSNIQRDTAATHLTEFRTADQLESNFLREDHAFQAYMATGEAEDLEHFFVARQRIARGLDNAAKVSFDDAPETAWVVAQRRAWKDWRRIADRMLA